MLFLARWCLILGANPWKKVSLTLETYVRSMVPNFPGQQTIDNNQHFSQIVTHAYHQPCIRNSIKVRWLSSTGGSNPLSRWFSCLLHYSWGMNSAPWTQVKRPPSSGVISEKLRHLICSLAPTFYRFFLHQIPGASCLLCYHPGISPFPGCALPFTWLPRTSLVFLKPTSESLLSRRLHLIKDSTLSLWG